MTDLDDAIDARLAAAGERWRAGVSTGPPALRTGAGTVHRNCRGALLASTAVLVAALATGATLLATGATGGEHERAEQPRQAVGTGVTTASDRPLSAGKLSLLLGVRSWRLAELRGGTGVYRSGLPVLGEPVSYDGRRLHLALGRCQTPTTVDVTVSEDQLTLGRRAGVIASCTGSLLDSGATSLLPDLLSQIVAGRSVEWQIDEHQLTITRPGVGTATFASSDTQPRTSLVGTRWALAGGIDSHGGQYGAEGRNHHLEIDGGTLTADDGFNGGTGSVAIHSRQLAVKDFVRGTAPHRPTSLYESAYALLVDSVIRDGDIDYRIVGDALFLERDGVLLIYRPSN